MWLDYLTISLLTNGDGLGSTLAENYVSFFPNSNVLVSVSKATWAMNLCTHKMVLFLTEVDK